MILVEKSRADCFQYMLDLRHTLMEIAYNGKRSSVDGKDGFEKGHRLKGMMEMSFLNQAVMVAWIGALISMAGCEEDKGSFGDTAPETPGVRVKATKPEPKNEAPDFASALSMTSSYDKAAGQVLVELKIGEGFHAYAPGEEVGIPVVLDVAADGNWKAEGESEMPAGKIKDLGELGKSLILEGAVPIRRKVTGGTGDIKGHVRVQICTKKACDRPRKHPFQVAMQ
jgi:hypothetical protein